MRPHNTRREFDRCWPWLDASLASFGRTHTMAQVWERIYHGHAMLWPSDNAVILSETIRHPIGLKSCNVWLQGGGAGGPALDELKLMHPELEAWARDNDCQRLIAWGRDGWLRVLDGWHSCGTRRTKWLTDVPDHLRETK
jgi:hypothetical protein